MNNKQILENTLKWMSEAGADKAQCELTMTTLHELNAAINEIKLLRTTENMNMKLIYIEDKKRGVISINNLDDASIQQGISEVRESAMASPQDEAYDVVEAHHGHYVIGTLNPDLDKAYDRLDELNAVLQNQYPQLNTEVCLSFTHSKRFIKNSNGLDVVEESGLYNYMSMFSAKDGNQVTSFNYSNTVLKDLENDLLEAGKMASFYEQALDELKAQPLNDKFVGDLIIAPLCLNEMIDSFTGIALCDSAIISGTSVLKDQLNQPIASELLSISAAPIGVDCGHEISTEGFRQKDVKFIENGVLKSFLLSHYGSRKASKTRSVADPSHFMVHPGNTTLEEMIKDVDKGILISRFSGGHPTTDGAISGVAKNSFYIEGGKIMYPIKETMMSGNLFNMLKDIQSISKETINFGNAEMPWLHTKGVTISG